MTSDVHPRTDGRGTSAADPPADRPRTRASPSTNAGTVRRSDTPSQPDVSADPAARAPAQRAGHDLRAEGLSLAYEARQVIADLDLHLPRAAITAIVGANGCGKSTLLRGLARLLRPTGGGVLLDGRSISTLPARELARTIGILPQGPQAPEGITVAELVRRGRYPHRSWFQPWDRSDDAAVAEALTATGIVDLAGRRVDELSGGQRQRVWIAMALAQEPDVLLLDEPTTFLDVTHQLEILDLLLELNRERGATVVMVLHDLNLAARYADHLVVMRAGAVHATGRPDQVLTEEIIAEAFGLRARVVPDPVSGGPLVVPIGRFHTTPPDHDLPH